MINFRISFTHPWFLFLFLLAVILTLIPYFKLPKKFRKNRNRILDIVFHLIICLIGTLLVSGMHFEYEKYNDKNEIIYLVDVSDSTKNVEDKRNELLENLIDYSSKDGYTIGVVTYGFNQKCVAPLSNQYTLIYDKYLESLDEESDIESNKTIDRTASNLSQALLFSKELIEYPETSKIVVITDGKETDGNTSSIIKSISSLGIKIDFCYIPTAVGGSDLQIVDFALPETHISTGTKSTFGFAMKSNKETKAMYNVYVDDKLVELEETKKEYNISEGTNNFSFNYTFEELGLHKLTIELNSEEDTIFENNKYTTYVNLEDMNKILIIESEFSNSTNLINSLNSENEFLIEVINLSNPDVEVPQTVDDLRMYDQVILNNVSNEDLKLANENFLKNLEEYVQVYGGGLLTIGGTDDDGNNHAYNRKDMYGSILQRMLPVEVINYKLPLGVIIVVDVSGSMSNYLQDAEDAAMSVLDVLGANDMVGVSTLSDTKSQSRLLELTPCSNKGKIITKMDLISDQKGGSTVFTPAIQDAASQLNSSGLARKHIIIVTDGQASDVDNYVEEANFLRQKENGGITFSMVSVTNMNGNYLNAAKEVTDDRVYFINDSNTIYDSIQEDLKSPEIIENVDAEEFNPTVNSKNFSSLYNDSDLLDNNELNFKVKSYFGTKAKDNDYVAIYGEYNVPLYAQWFYGNGTVGSLMVDINDSDGTMLTEGVNVLKRAIKNIMPTSDISPNQINFNVRNTNYSNDISIYATLENGERITGSVTNVDTGEVISLNEAQDEDNINYSFYTSILLNDKNSYSRCSFIMKKSGIYKIEINKVNASGEVICTTTKYQSFSYSNEFDSYLYEDVDMDKKIETLADKGNGIVVNEENLEDVFDTFNPLLHNDIDPRIVFIIIIIVLFLLEIIVRKFKFKWIHEIVKDYKINKDLN